MPYDALYGTAMPYDAYPGTRGGGCDGGACVADAAALLRPFMLTWSIHVSVSSPASLHNFSLAIDDTGSTGNFKVAWLLISL